MGTAAARRPLLALVLGGALGCAGARPEPAMPPAAGPPAADVVAAPAEPGSGAPALEPAAVDAVAALLVATPRGAVAAMPPAIATAPAPEPPLSLLEQIAVAGEPPPALAASGSWSGGAESLAATAALPASQEAAFSPVTSGATPAQVRAGWRASAEERQRLLEKGPCEVEPPPGEAMIDATRRRLYQTVCGAALWFDGLFGEQRHIAAAQRASGRLELSFVESEYHGFKARTRFDVRVRFPNLENRLEAFVGRDDDDKFVADRSEGLAIRTQFRDLESDEDRWVAGLGYGLPGSYEQKTDFRLGGRGGRTPRIFGQGRHRRNWFVGEHTLFHFRYTAFWTNREGAGMTSGLDFDRVLAPNLLLRLGGVGTWSQETEGVDYRGVLVFYQNLVRNRSALAYEAFARGESDEEVKLEEYGLRLVFRRPIARRNWLFGELVGGYSWIQEELAIPRQGSYAIGFGIELLFGREAVY